MGPPAHRVAHLPGLLLLFAAACLASPAVPRLAAPVVVDIHAAPPAPAFPLRQTSSSRRRPGVIVIPPAPPLLPSIAPAVLLDGRLWCPRRTQTGGSTLHPGLPEVSQAAVRVERLLGDEARQYATRCSAPTDGVFRIVRRSPRGR